MTLSREHHFKGRPWAPHPDALRVAEASERYMDLDDHVDRYLLRMRELDKEPSSTEWLRWLIDEDARAKREMRLQQRHQLTNEYGTPNAWHV